MKESESESRLALSDCLRSHGLYSPWNSPGQNNGVSSLSHLQGIFPTQGSNPGLPHCRQILIHPSHKGSLRIFHSQGHLYPHRLKHLPAMRETWVRSLGWKDPLEKEMETHSSILAWRIPWTEEPGGLQSMESQSRTRLSDFTFILIQNLCNIPSALGK